MAVATSQSTNLPSAAGQLVDPGDRWSAAFNSSMSASRAFRRRSQA
jgi:hypothetical protein